MDKNKKDEGQFRKAWRASGEFLDWAAIIIIVIACLITLIKHA